MPEDSIFRLPPEHSEERPAQEAARLLLGGPVALVTSTWRGQENVAPVAWHMPLASVPPLVGIAIEQSRYSADLIAHAGEFALNFPKRPFLHHVQYLGGLSGADIDKFEATQWETFAASSITSPLLQDCVAWIECEVVDKQPFGDHILFVGLVVAVRVDPASYDTDRRQWRLGGTEDRPLHFLGGNRYSSLQGELEARTPQDFEAPERALRERVMEELELTREARERREEMLGALEDEVRRGNVVDMDDLGITIDDQDVLDLARGILLDRPDEDAL